MEWDPSPVMLVIGPVAVRWYGVWFTVGLFLTIWWGHRIFPQRGLEEKHASNLTFATLTGLFIGAHLFEVLFYNWDAFMAEPSMILDPRRGLSSHGGAFGVVVAVLAYARFSKIGFHRLADAVVQAAMWLVPTVRLGNFFNSEIVGRPTDLPWGIVFVQTGLPEPRHPSQLYESLMGVGLLVLCAWLHRHRDRIRVGATFYAVLGSYFAVRFFLEFAKEYQAVAPGFPLTMGQFLSLPGAIICGGALWLMRPIVRAPESESERAPEPEPEPEP